MSKQAYNLGLDVPPPTLVAKQNIPEANQMYMTAMAYKDKGWGNDYIDNQRPGRDPAAAVVDELS